VKLKSDIAGFEWIRQLRHETPLWKWREGIGNPACWSQGGLYAQANQL